MKVYHILVWHLWNKFNMRKHCYTREVFKSVCWNYLTVHKKAYKKMSSKSFACSLDLVLASAVYRKHGVTWSILNVFCFTQLLKSWILSKYYQIKEMVVYLLFTMQWLLAEWILLLKQYKSIKTDIGEPHGSCAEWQSVVSSKIVKWE